MTFTILDCLVEDLRIRQEALRADRNRHTFYLKDVDPNMLIQVGYASILVGLQKKGTLTDIVVSMGRQIRRTLSQPKDDIIGAHTGWFVTISFLELGIFHYKMKDVYKNGKKSKHQSYYLEVSDWEISKYLWTLLDKNKTGGMFPFRAPPANWVKPIHENGTTIVKKMHSSLAGKLSPENNPILFSNLNKLQNTGWEINSEVFNVYQQALSQSSRGYTTDSPFKFSKEIDTKVRDSLIREAESIQTIAMNYSNEPFYHMYNYDFRYRLYVMTAYLHEQSSDNAKGILRFAKGVKLGEDGFFWLKVHCANTFGNDKIKLDERAEFVSQKMAEFIGYAKAPLINRGWMQTDAPFSFLSCCFELKKIMEWVMEGNTIEDFVSKIPCYIDGSTNGTQHLTAMSLDETIAHLVNLVPTEYPGDLYMYIANHVWGKLQTMVDEMDPKVAARFDEIFAESKKLFKEYSEAPPRTEQKAMAFLKSKEWRNVNRDLRAALFPVYWLKVDKPKDQRKCVKRNVMTLG